MYCCHFECNLFLRIFGVLILPFSSHSKCSHSFHFQAMPPPTKGGALPPKSGKGTVRRPGGAHSATSGKAPNKSGSAAGSRKSGGTHKAAKKSGGGSNRKSHLRKDQDGWHYYINRARSSVSKKHSLSRRAMMVMGSLVEDLFERLATEAINVAHVNRVKTLSGRELQIAVRLLMQGDLQRFGMTEGTRAVLAYDRNLAEVRKARENGSAGN